MSTISRRENNRDDRRRLLGSQDHASARRDNDINLSPDEFGGDLGRALVASLRPSIFDCDIDPQANQVRVVVARRRRPIGLRPETSSSP